MRNLRYTIVMMACGALLAGHLSAIGPRERVYAQTDKPVYLAGELLWTKLVVTDAAGLPVSLSKVGYVELLDATTAQVQARVNLVEGVGEACLELPAMLPTGYYRLVAYTRQARNEGEAAYFHTTIGVVNTFRKDGSVPTDTTLWATATSDGADGITLRLDKKTFGRREQGEVLLEGLPADLRTLSLSIAGHSALPVPGRTDLSAWHSGLSARADLPLNGTFLPEYEGPIIEGKLIDTRTGEAVTTPGVQTLLGFVGEETRVFGGQQQADHGSVLFLTKRIDGSGEVAVTTYDPLALGTGTGSPYRVDIESPFALHPETEMPRIKLNSAWRDELERRHVGLQVTRALNARQLGHAERALPHFRWAPDKSYLLDEYKRFPTMGETVFEFVESVSFRKRDGKQTLFILLNDLSNGALQMNPPLVLLDGIPIVDHQLVYDYDPALVKQIDVYRDRYSFGGQSFEGIFSITTKQGHYPSLRLTEPSQLFDYEGTQPRRLFWAPDYADEAARAGRLPDYRHTLLWLPEVPTDGGSSVRVPFSTSDLRGTYEVVVEGFTRSGQVIYGRVAFRVE